MVKKKKAVKDKYYKLAKEQGYRARSCFKLIQLNRKYDLLSKATRVIDLCAAPGGWMQVAAKTMPLSPDRQIIGVDLLPIKPLKGCVAMQADITTSQCRHMIKKELNGKKADFVMCDGAPNVGADYSKDAFVQSELVVHALRFATDHLVKGGNFVSKVFRSADYNALMWAMKQLFQKVEATKPASSRNVSAEIFVVCRGYLAPHQIDPKLLDPVHVLQQVQEDKKPAGDMLFHKKNTQKKNRGGYDDNLGQGLHKSVTVSEFVKSNADAMTMLAEAHEIKFDDKSLALKEHKETTDEVIDYLKDIKVLGKSELRLLLRWQITMKKYIRSLDSFIKPDKDEEESADEREEEEEESEDEEKKIEAEMEELQKSEQQKKKREKKRKAREHAKQMERKKLGMNNEYAIDMEDVNHGPFSLKSLKIKNKTDLDGIREVNLSRVDASQVPGDSDENDGEFELNKGSGSEQSDSDDSSDDDYEGNLEKQLEEYHERFTSKKAESEPMSVRQRRQEQQAHKLAKQKKRKLEQLQQQDMNRALEEEEAKAVSRGEYHKLLEGKNDSDSESDSELESDAAEELSPEDAKQKAQAKQWFQQDLFKVVEEAEDVALPSQKTDKHLRHEKRLKDRKKKENLELRKKKALAKTDPEAALDAKLVQVKRTHEADKAEAAALEQTTLKDKKTRDLISRGVGKLNSSEADSKSFEVVKSTPQENEDEEYHSSDYDSDENAQALALGSLLIKKSSRRKLLDSSYNRYAFNDNDLPSWFVSDESKHNRPQLPITREMVDAVKARYKDLAAKPINKVAEARGRKKRKLMLKVEAAKKKAAALVDAPDLTARSKMRAIEKLYKGTDGIKRPSAVYVVSRKAAKGKPNLGGSLKGQRVKLVDRRQKADPGKRPRKNGKTQGKRTKKRYKKR